MKTVVVFVCLLVAVAAKPQGFGFGHFGGANGFANSGSTQGQSSNFLGNSQIQSSFANAGGSAFGGGSSFNRASSNIGQSSGFGGNRQFANNHASSNQFGR